VEFGRAEQAGLPRVAVGVGQQGEDGSGVQPLLTGASLGQHEEFPEGEGAEVEAEDPGAVPDEAIHRRASASGSSWSSTVSA